MEEEVKGVAEADAEEVKVEEKDEVEDGAEEEEEVEEDEVELEVNWKAFFSDQRKYDNAGELGSSRKLWRG